MSSALLYQTDMLLEVAELQNAATKQYLHAAEVTVTLVDARGTPIEGQTWPLALVYVSGSKGTYRGTLSADLDLKPRQEVTALITANAGPGLRRHWQMPLQCRVAAA